MSNKQRRRLCRIKANKIGKFITLATLLIFFGLAHVFNLDGYTTAAIGTTLWFYVPDLAVYLLESKYHISHDHVSYR